MYVDIVPNRNSPPAVLLRQAIREGKKIRKVTVANLSDWPEERVSSLGLLLKGETLVPVNQAFTIARSQPHGHVAAALGTLRRLGLERIVNRESCRERDLAVAMVVARILEPASKLATVRGLEAETASSSLGSCLGVETVSEDELYRVMDWLPERQGQIEKQLAKRHLQHGCLGLYDLTSTYFEGRHCPIAHYGHSRDERAGNLQIVFGLLADQDGRPVAVEVFEGNTADPKTVAAQVEKLRVRFGLDGVILVGDRGMLASARIEKDLRSSGLDWITALRSVQIRSLVDCGCLQLSLFDQQDLSEISHPDYSDTVSEHLPAAAHGSVRSVLGVAVFDLSNYVQQFRGFDFCDGTTTQVGEDVVFEPRINTFAMALRFRINVLFQPFASDHFKTVCSAAGARCFLGFAVNSRINGLRQLFAARIPFLPGCCEAHVVIDAE